MLSSKLCKIVTEVEEPGDSGWKLNHKLQMALRQKTEHLATDGY